MNNAENNNDLETLPEGWTAGELGDLCDLNRSTLNPPFHGAEEYVGLEHIDSGKFFLSRFGTPDEVRSTKNCFEPGFILYGKLRPYLDKAVVAQTSGICSTDVLVFTAKNEVPPEFVVSVLHTDMFVEHAKKTTHGVNHPRTSWKSIKEYSLAIPPVNEQQKIAAVLLKLQKAILIQERTLETLRELKKTALQRIFTQGLHGKSQSTDLGPIPEGWEWKKFGEFARLHRGYDLPVQNRGEGDIPIIGSNGIVGYHDEAKIKGPGVVTGRSGTIGLAFFIEGDYWPLNTSLYVEDFFGNDPLYVHYFFERFDFSPYKSGVSVPTLNRNSVHSVDVAVPDVTEQKQIAAIFQTLDKKIGVHERKRDTLNELFRTTLNQLMTARIRVNNLKIDTSEVEG